MPLLKDYFTRYGRGAIIALAVIVCAGFLVRAWVVVNPLADPGDDALAYRALAEALYKDAVVANREINFIDCCINIMGVLQCPSISFSL